MVPSLFEPLKFCCINHNVIILYSLQLVSSQNILLLKTVLNLLDEASKHLNYKYLGYIFSSQQAFECNPNCCYQQPGDGAVDTT